MSLSKVSITSILLLSTALSGCSSEHVDKEESMNSSADKLSETSQQESTANINATADLKLSDDMQKVSPDTPELLVLQGQILFQQMEGGFFGFIDESGNKYTPIGMDKDNLRHGLVIQLTGKLLPNMITTTQFGQVIKVESVVIIDESKAQEPGRPNLRDKDL
ncbi:MAG: hypothetical protein ACI89W_001814 [Gammaproteobacteria bacterium]|jgi:hypothetical protein